MLKTNVLPPPAISLKAPIDHFYQIAPGLKSDPQRCYQCGWKLFQHPHVTADDAHPSALAGLLPRPPPQLVAASRILQRELTMSRRANRLLLAAFVGLVLGFSCQVIPSGGTEMEEETKPVARKKTDIYTTIIGVGIFMVLGAAMLWGFYDLATTDYSAQLAACFDFASSPVGRLFHAVSGK